MLNFVLSEFFYKKKLLNHTSIKSKYLPLALQHCQSAPSNWNCNVMTSRESNAIDYSDFLSEFKGIVASMCDDLKTVGPVELRIESIWMNL